MAKVISITEKLNNEDTYVEIAEGKQYKVNKNYKVLMKVTDLLSGDKVDYVKSIMDAIELLLGKKARAEIEDMTLENITVVFKAALAAAQGTTYEEMDDRFQKAE